MKLETMEKALKTYPNRFQLTMMAVARAKELNDGESPIVVFEDPAKPVVTALKEIADGAIVPGSHDDMSRIREARRTLRERALMEAEARQEQEESEEESVAEVPEEGDPEKNQV